MKTLLLVEDDEKIVIALQYRLKSMGYIVRTASDAIFAMQEAVRCQPDAILLDINLPGGDGFVVADRIRTSTQVAATPIIFITASRKSEFRERARLCGAAAYLEKPFGLFDLTNAIESCVAH